MSMPLKRQLSEADGRDPVTKRARLSCAMLDKLGRDSCAVFHLVSSYVHGKEVGNLVASCKWWRDAFAKPTKLMSSVRRGVKGTPHRLAAAMANSWMRNTMQNAHIVVRTMDGGREPVAAEDSVAAAGLVLARMPNLLRLNLQLNSIDAPPAALASCLGAHLRELVFSLTNQPIVVPGVLLVEPGVVTRASPGRAVHELLGLLHLVPHLEVLVISNMEGGTARLNLSKLPQLKKLHSLTITATQTPSYSVDLNHIQSKALSQCKQLRTLKVGRWSEQHGAVLPAGWDANMSKQYVDARIGALISGKVKSYNACVDAIQVAMSKPDYTSSTVLAKPDACYLRNLDLRDGTVMTSRVWHWVSQANTLQELEPRFWRSDITDAQWAQLATFFQLRTFRLWVSPLDAANPIRIDQFLPHLLRCTQLKSVDIQCAAISKRQLTDLVCQLFELCVLILRDASVESVDVLRDAHKLRSLGLMSCEGPLPLKCLRIQLPLMPKLEMLTIHDKVRMTEAQVEVGNKRLLSLMPRIQLKQNLLAVAAPAPAPVQA